MRRALLLGIICCTIFSTITAAASSLVVKGGALQSFIYEANIPVPKPQTKQKREAKQPPEARSVPDRTMPVFDSGVRCSDDGKIWLCIANTASDPLNDLSWVLYHDGVKIRAEELPSIQAQEVYTITAAITEPGTYQFSLESTGDQDSAISTLSDEIIVDGGNCPILFANAATATVPSIEATIEVRDAATPTPFAPAATSSQPPITPTELPPPTFTPQATPTEEVPAASSQEEATATTTANITATLTLP